MAKSYMVSPPAVQKKLLHFYYLYLLLAILVLCTLILSLLEAVKICCPFPNHYHFINVDHIFPQSSLFQVKMLCATSIALNRPSFVHIFYEKKYSQKKRGRIVLIQLMMVSICDSCSFYSPNVSS